MHRPLGPIRAIIALLVSLLVLQAAAKSKESPKITVSELDGRPQNVLYFEDSDVVLYTDGESGTAYRSDDGGAAWSALKGVDKKAVLEIVKHPNDNKVAVAIGAELTHWITWDRGASWEEFTVPKPASTKAPAVAFHATDSKRMLFMAEECHLFLCDPYVYYTTDGFQKSSLLRENTINCIWAKTTDLFTTGYEELDRDQILCVAPGRFSMLTHEYRVLMSSDFFKSEAEPLVDGSPVKGITNLAAVKHYIVCAAKSKGTSELAMYVTDDTKTWKRAEFGGHRLEESAYTLLESTNYSMQVDIMPGGALMGALLTSNSNGTFFTSSIAHTNRDAAGFVDFEKIANVQGVVLVNVVDNYKELERSPQAEKDILSKISFDDGRTWEALNADGKTLHLHSVTAQRNFGRIFSSPAPGIVMGNGNTGDVLKAYSKADLFVSDDAGLNWKKAREGPHMYEFGAQGSVLVAIGSDDKEAVDEIAWSLDHGAKWSTMKLDKPVYPYGLTTTPDSTSLKFLLIATTGKGADLKWQTIALDFEGLHERECKSSDFETWSARLDSKGKDICVMGHIQKFKRRKAGADCIVANDNFADPEETTEKCDCTRVDYECDYNFKLDKDEKTCVQAGTIRAPEGACDKEDAEFEGPSGYRLVPGNQCKGGEDLAKPIKRKCSESKAPAKSGLISHEITSAFKAANVVEYYYLEQGLNVRDGEEETIVMRTDEGEVWITHDHGKTWKQILKDEKILGIVPHQYNNDLVYFITPSKKVYYSARRGLESQMKYFEVPGPPTRERGVPVLSFHPKEKNWLIWTTSHDCKGTSSSDCENVAYVSLKGGDDWDKLLPAVRKCLFVYREERVKSDELIFCEQHSKEDLSQPYELVKSLDKFEHHEDVAKNVINYATMAEYIVVAIRDEEKKSLRIETSIDGVTFAHAEFPKNLEVPHQTAYTVMDSSTHAIFLHVTVSADEGKEYGSIVKSNSNGTSYVLSVTEVNRNSQGFVDFEKMQGIEGVAVINRVANVKEVGAGAAKKLKTHITHNDGAAWELIPRPEDPPKEIGEPFECKSGAECTLHLHGYTERLDPRDSYSSASAVGIMLANGNVGAALTSRDKAHTFITRDAGVTWSMIAAGNWMWEFGDQGSIIVIVKEDEPTSAVRYSLDEGKTWTDYSFEQEMVVKDLSTVPSDSSRNFLLWGKIGNKLTTINLDFSGMKERSKVCVVDEEDEGKSDFALWSPKHPDSDTDCLFGHVAQYHRKKIDRDCYIDPKTEIYHGVQKNCTCTREDFECDYNYERAADGTCKLVPGLTKADPAAVCAANPDLLEFHGITGYRRIPLSTCAGGKELDYTSEVYPCKGHEEDFNKKHGVSGAGLFFAIVLPIAAAAAVGYWVWKNWDGKFGRIQLGGDGGFGSSSHRAFDRDAPWIKYPVIALSGLVAVIAALPMLAGSLWRAVATRLGRSSSGRGSYGGYNRPYTSRSSFQRGDYAVVDPDDGELLGDSDDDI